MSIHVDGKSLQLAAEVATPSGLAEGLQKSTEFVD